MPAPPFDLVYDPEVRDHLDAIESKYHSLIRTALEEQLLFDPEVTTRNRKPLERPIAFDARWELRFGPDNCFRAFYRVEMEERRVRVLAIGVKDRNRLYIGGKLVKP